MPPSSQLAAILFTDIVGYTALMGTDEKKAYELLQQNRQIQQPIISRYKGKWIKEMGDGVLATFLSVSDAVFCALAIQDAVDTNGEFKLRIGIHQGEVIFEDNDVFGDGVNIASRIQSLATPGSIWISESVYLNINNKKEISTKYIGEKNFKNIKEPLRIYEVFHSVQSEVQSSTLTQQRTRNIPEKSIAVLPFVNMSNDPEQEYFSDGMAEELINSLHHLKDIKVAGRSSSFQFKGKNMDLRELGEKLGVRMVLEGSIRKYGNRIRITAQLINVEDGFHIWSEKFDREMNDIFALQDEIAFAITEQLKVNMFENDREKIAKIHTQNAEAYELYLKGRFHTNRRGSSILTGLKCFKQAISIDPGYALAYVGYADANSLSAVYNFLPGIEVMGEVKKSAEKAIQLDPTLSEAYCTLASYHVFFDRDFEKARKNFQHSIELNYQNSQAHAWYGMLLHCFIDGNFEEAEKEGMIAIKLEPLSSINHADLAWTYLMSGRYTDGLTTAKMGIELDANSFLSYRIAGLCYNAMGEFDNAIMLLQKMMQLFNNHPQAVAALIWSYCGRGKTDEARQLMKMLEEKPADFYRPGIFYANSAANLGDLDKAMKYMNKAYQEYDPQLHQLKYAPDVPPLLRKDPRFQELLNKISKCAEPLL